MPKYRSFKPEDGLKKLFGITGIYFLMKSGNIDYIGRSLNIGNRLMSHHVFDRNFHDEIVVLEIPFENRYQLRNIERELIHKYSPPMNINATARQSSLQMGKKLKRHNHV